MEEELNLVRDLAVILISAGVFTIISKALKQPLVLGYILAGFLIGPNVDFFFGISSNEAVHQWSEIGIIFMMFGLGLEFSFKKLLKVGSGALITAGSKAVGVFVLGFVVGQAMGWTSMECVFLGGLLSMSSTAVVIKSYEDMGLKNKPYAGMVFGTLVVEDLIAILLMVLLSTMAVSNKFAGGEMLFNLGKLAFFLILWFLVGIYVIPTLLSKARKWLNDEILLIVSIGLCLGMVTFASAVGFSSALGAFVMGSILAETTESEHIEKLVGPIKNLFGAIFFISVGMMVSPSVIAANWFIILILALLVIVTHILFSAFGVVITGGGLENGVHTGFSLAQLGEFGFIIAGVGVSLGVMREFIYPVIIAVSVITTFTTPYMIKLAAPSYNFLLRKLPQSWLKRLSQSEGRPQKRSSAEKNDWQNLLKAYFLRILMYGVIILAISIGVKVYFEPFIVKTFPSWSPILQKSVIAGSTLLLMAPFIYGLAVSRGSLNLYAPRLIKAKQGNVWPILGLILARTFLAIGIVISVISSHFNLSGWVTLLIIAAGVAFFLFARRSMHKYSFLEQRFFQNLNTKEEQQMRLRPVSSSIMKKMAGHDVQTREMVISPDSAFVGRKLEDLHFRLETGANIVKISRGRQSILIPWGDTLLYPGDVLVAVGTASQLDALREKIDASVSDAPVESPDFEVITITLRETSYLTGKTLRSAKLRDRQCMVISLLRGEQFITNPKPDFEFEPGDIVWVAGETSACESLKAI